MKKIVLSALLIIGGKMVEVAATGETAAKKYNLDYKTPRAFLDDFVDLSKKSHEPLRYWATQFLLICQQKPELKEFSYELAKIVKYKNPTRIGCLMLMYQDSFGKEMENLIFALGVKRVYHALEERCKEGKC